MRSRRLPIITLLFTLVLSLPAATQAPPTPVEEWSTTQHSLKLGAQTIPYTLKKLA